MCMCPTCNMWINTLLKIIKGTLKSHIRSDQMNIYIYVFYHIVPLIMNHISTSGLVMLLSDNVTEYWEMSQISPVNYLLEKLMVFSLCVYVAVSLYILTNVSVMLASSDLEANWSICSNMEGIGADCCSRQKLFTNLTANGWNEDFSLKPFCKEVVSIMRATWITDPCLSMWRFC